MVRKIVKSIVQSVAVFVVLALALAYVAAQQPAVTATQTVSGYVLGPDDEIVIRAIDAPEISATSQSSSARTGTSHCR